MRLLASATWPSPDGPAATSPPPEPAECPDVEEDFDRLSSPLVSSGIPASVGIFSRVLAVVFSVPLRRGEGRLPPAPAPPEYICIGPSPYTGGESGEPGVEKRGDMPPVGLSRPSVRRLLVASLTRERRGGTLPATAVVGAWPKLRGQTEKWGLAKSIWMVTAGMSSGCQGGGSLQ